MKVFLIGAYAPSLLNFRGELLKVFFKSGFDVVALASAEDDVVNRGLNDIGVRFYKYSVSRNGLNPFKDAFTFLSLINAYRLEKPNYVLAYTIKPIIWGGLASQIAKIPNFYALVTGLGYAFQRGSIKKNILNFIIRKLYKIALIRCKGVIFQNKDNMAIFINEGIVPENKCYLVNGSGVDLSHFKKEPLPKSPKFLLIARLLGDKGIREYAQAAKQVRSRYPNAEFHLVGPEDSSPDGISASETLAWHNEGSIHYHGSATDVRPFIKDCSIFVLPSYHEGMPRTVLEAMAMGRPILTTDVPGCRETVVNGENGWLVEKANVEQLVDKMIWFIEHSEQWSVMGDKGHTMATEKFDVHKINKELMQIMGLVDETSS